VSWVLSTMSGSIWEAWWSSVAGFAVDARGFGTLVCGSYLAMGAFWCNAIRTHLAHRYRQTPPRLDLAQPLAIGGNAFWWCIRRWRCVGTFVVCMTINEMTVWQLPKMMRWRLSFDMFSCGRLVPCEKSSRVLDGDYGVLSQVTKCEN
jgi:hypothetical protein